VVMFFWMVIQVTFSIGLFSIGVSSPYIMHKSFAASKKKAPYTLV